MAATSKSTVAALYKTVFMDGVPQNVAIAKKHPTLDVIKKERKPFGRGFEVPIIFGTGQGMGSTVAQAEAAESASVPRAWVLTPKKYYGSISFDRADYLDSESNVAAYLDVKRLETENMLKGMGNTLGRYLFGQGYGTLGRVAAVAGNTATLTNTGGYYYESFKDFYIGMKVVSSVNENGTAPDAGQSTVTNVVGDDGTGVAKITFDAIGNIGVNDYLFRQSDNNVVYAGFRGWLPLTPPLPGGGDSWFGVDRGVYPEMLAGSRVLDVGTIEENIQTLAVKIQRLGGAPDIGVVNPLPFQSLIKQLGSKVTRDAGGMAKFGYRSVLMDTPAGTIEIVSDPDCDVDRGYLLKQDSWRIRHIGPGMIHLVDDDGLDMRMVSGEDSWRSRFASYFQLYTNEPSANGVFSITP